MSIVNPPIDTMKEDKKRKVKEMIRQRKGSAGIAGITPPHYTLKVGATGT